MIESLRSRYLTMLDKYLMACSLVSVLCILQNAVLGIIDDDNGELIFSREVAGSRSNQKNCFLERLA